MNMKNQISHEKMLCKQGHKSIDSKQKRLLKKKKEKKKINFVETSKQQTNANQIKNHPHMTYNLIYYLTKLKITLPFIEVVKIPWKRENILKILHEPNTRIEVVITNSESQFVFSEAKPKGKFSSFYITI
jgi:hypothetical protein